MNVEQFMDGGLEALLAQDSDESDVEAMEEIEQEAEQEQDGEQDAAEEDAAEEDDDDASDMGDTLAEGEQGSDDNDSDDNEDDEDDEELLSEVQQHQAQLEKLKQQDPEFFQYLEAEDQQLLDFGDDSDAEPAGDDEEEDEDDDEAAAEAEAEAGLESSGKNKRQELSRKTVRAWASLMDKVGNPPPFPHPLPSECGSTNLCASIQAQPCGTLCKGLPRPALGWIRRQKPSSPSTSSTLYAPAQVRLLREGCAFLHVLADAICRQPTAPWFNWVLRPSLSFWTDYCQPRASSKSRRLV